jgi:electron transport complex protein RnfG
MQLKNSTLKRLYPVLLLTAVVLVSVILLSFIDNLTRGKIEEEQEKQTNRMLQAMFPAMTGYTLINDIYVIESNNQRIGYAYIATGRGYGGTISILVGLEDENTIKGISIVSQTETAGLGNRITMPSFTDQFADKQINDIKLKRDNGQIDGITGATISSKAVIEAVRNTALEKVKNLPK